MKRLEVYFQRPPSVNNLFANVPRRGRVPTRGYRAWQERAGWALARQLNDWEMLTGPVKVAASFDKRNGDIDNYSKGALDLLATHRVYKDDSQVVSLQLDHDPECRDLMFVHVEAAE